MAGTRAARSLKRTGVTAVAVALTALLSLFVAACSGSGSDTSTPTAAGLAAKLHDDHICKKVAPAPKEPIHGAWSCGMDFALDGAFVWAFPSKRAVRQAERRLVTRTCGQLTDAHERGSFLAVPDPDGDREVPIVFVEGRSWLVAFSDTGGPEPWKAATALHGKVTEKQWCPPADPGPDAT